ncbi:MAG: YbbR-like domain-containing protein [Erysipelotrichaceae bacterium]
MFGKKKKNKEVILKNKDSDLKIEKPKKIKKEKKKKVKRKRKIDIRSEKSKTDWAEKIGKRTSDTYNSTEALFLRAFKPISDLFDKIVFNRKFAALTSLILAVIMVVGLNYGDFQELTNSYRTMTTRENVEVMVIGNTDVYEILGIPETVTARIVGDLADLQLVQSSTSFTIVADLSGLSEGVHSVPLVAQNYSSNLDVQVEPSTVTVSIARKVSQQYYVGYEYINTNQAKSIYDFGVPTFDKTSVIVRASQDTLNKISSVKALIDVANMNADFEQEAILVAYDQTGNKIDVDIVPSAIKVSVAVTSPNKTVPIVIAPVGDIPGGQSIERITLDHDSITLYGPLSVLENIDKLVIPVDVSNMTSERTDAIAEVVLPSGVKGSDIKKVNYSLSLGVTATKKFEGVSIRYINYDDDKYRFTLVDANDATVDVIISGTESNLANIKVEDLDVYVDLATIKSGTLSIPIVVDGNNVLLIYAPSRDNLDIIVEEN